MCSNDAVIETNEIIKKKNTQNTKKQVGDTKSHTKRKKRNRRIAILCVKNDAEWEIDIWTYEVQLIATLSRRGKYN